MPPVCIEAVSVPLEIKDETGLTRTWCAGTRGSGTSSTIISLTPFLITCFIDIHNGRRRGILALFDRSEALFITQPRLKRVHIPQLTRCLRTLLRICPCGDRGLAIQEAKLRESQVPEIVGHLLAARGYQPSLGGNRESTFLSAGHLRTDSAARQFTENRL